MALCEEKLAGCIASPRTARHFPARLGNRVVFVSWLGVRKLNHNANNLPRYRCANLWNFGELHWFTRWEKEFQISLCCSDKRSELFLTYIYFSRHAWNDWLWRWVHKVFISSCWMKFFMLTFRSHFNLPTVLYKNVGWGNFEGYEKLEAVLR